MQNGYQVIVQKYGGSSLASSEKLLAVARKISALLSSNVKTNTKLCVIVSAMGHTTNELINLATNISESPSKREMDMLLSCGERSSMALLAIALRAMGVRAISLTGSQSGIITDENHNNASIIAVRPWRIHESFAKNDVIIVAGFQGISRKNEITTLKRGGSDTTAVSIAAALKAQYVDIYSDVEGVMDADPSIIKYAKRIPKVSFCDMDDLSLYGARILAHDALNLAQKLSIETHIKDVRCKNEGTLIKEFSIDEGRARKQVLAITHLRGVLKFDSSSLKSTDINARYMLCGYRKDNGCIIYASNDIAQEIVLNKASSIYESGFALITIHLSSSADLMAINMKIEELAKNSMINLVDGIFGGKKIFLIIKDENLVKTLPIIYDHVLSLEESK